MANFRQIHVSIWKDSWFLDLEPDEKLLFIYLFSNESTSLSGIYRVSRKVIAFETGLDKQRINEILEKFCTVGKVYNENDIIWIVNMRKFHETKSRKVQIRINGDVSNIPDCDIKSKYIAYHNGKIPYPYPMDTTPQLKEDEKEDEDEKKKKEDKQSPSAADVSEVVTAYESNIAVITPSAKETLVDWLKDYPKNWILDSFKIAVEYNKRNIRYCQVILDRWEREGKDDGKQKVAADVKGYTHG